jgi:hypothetical protein
MAREYQLIAQGEEKRRRTIADVLDILRDHAGFDEHDRAHIRVAALLLLSGRPVGAVVVCFEPSDREKGYAVSLPASSYFRAIRHGSSERDKFSIEQLDNAEVDADGNVLLSDKTKIRAVEVEPTPLPVEPTDIQWRIIHYTLEFIRADHCYRSLRDVLPAELQQFAPDRRYLDCSTLGSLEFRSSLNEIARFIAEKDWTLRRLSRQTIADALCTFGIREPVRRSHV